MGEAGRRGDFEARVKQAIERKVRKMEEKKEKEKVIDPEHGERLANVQISMFADGYISLEAPMHDKVTTLGLLELAKHTVNIYRPAKVQDSAIKRPHLFLPSGMFSGRG